MVGGGWEGRNRGGGGGKEVNFVNGEGRCGYTGHLHVRQKAA